MGDRAREVMNADKVCDGLDNRIHLDFDAVAAYDAATAPVEKDDECRRAFEGFRQDHPRHTQDLGRPVEEYGGVAARRADARRYGTKGMVLLGGLIGGEAVIRARNDHERIANDGCERALGKDFPDDRRDSIQRDREDERRHKTWIEARLEREKAAPPRREPPPTRPGAVWTAGGTEGSGSRIDP